MKKIIIFGKTQERANYMLKKILNNTPYGKARGVGLKKDKFRFVTDECEYLSLGAFEYNKGYRCDEAYVDGDISIEMFNSVVIAALTTSPYKYTVYSAS